MICNTCGKEKCTCPNGPTVVDDAISDLLCPSKALIVKPLFALWVGDSQMFWGEKDEATGYNLPRFFQDREMAEKVMNFHNEYRTSYGQLRVVEVVTGDHNFWEHPDW